MRWVSSFGAAAVLLVLARAALADDADALDVGYGAGTYLVHLGPTHPAASIDFREIGGEVAHRDGALTFGLQASARADDVEIEPGRGRTPFALTYSVGQVTGHTGGTGTTGGTGNGAGDDPSRAQPVYGGTRWRVAPWVGFRWRDVNAKLGVMAGNYYAPLEPAEGHTHVLPLAAIGVGNPEYRIDLGFLDTPALASSTMGGLGVLSIKIDVRMAPGHRFVVGVSAPLGSDGSAGETAGLEPDDGCFTYEYRAEFEGLTIDFGGYQATKTIGLFLGLGSAVSLL